MTAFLFFKIHGQCYICVSLSLVHVTRGLKLRERISLLNKKTKIYGKVSQQSADVVHTRRLTNENVCIEWHLGLFVCVYVWCVFICMCARVHMHTCSHTCRDQKSMLGAFLDPS